MEVAATARTLGTRVTVVEPAELPLLAALGPDVATRFADVHRAQGVDLRTRTGLDRLEGAAAVLSDGTRIEPDTVLVGIGAIPNVELRGCRRPVRRQRGAGRLRPAHQPSGGLRRR